MGNLARRGINVNLECSICGYEVESVKHVFMDCWWVKSFWSATGIPQDHGIACSSVGDWFWHLLSTGNKETIQRMMMGAHLVWYNRNLVAHGQLGGSISHYCFKISGILAQFERGKLLGFNDGIEVCHNPGEKWDIYCDGSWSWLDGKGGWAAVILKNNIVEECAADFARSGTSGLQTEANALVLGLQLAAKRNCTAATIYSDCISVIWAFQRGECQEGLQPETLHRGLNLLRNNQSWILKHTLREDNMFADALAKRARICNWKWDKKDAIPVLRQSDEARVGDLHG